MPKRGELGQFVDSRGAWQERGGGVDTPMPTMVLLEMNCTQIIRLNVLNFQNMWKKKLCVLIPLVIISRNSTQIVYML